MFFLCAVSKTLKIKLKNKRYKRYYKGEDPEDSKDRVETALAVL